jgi:bifunctional non-homologous end joining protein LigD
MFMRLPAGFIPPCLPTKAQQPPSGEAWLHEIKHDGFRVIARKDGHRVRLYSRPGNDLTHRFPLIVEALAWLRSQSCIIDGEAVCCDDYGMPNFDRIRYRFSFGLGGVNAFGRLRSPRIWVVVAHAAVTTRATDGVLLTPIRNRNRRSGRDCP